MSWYRMERGWKDHAFFSKEPYSERDAWQWMIEEAHWKPGVVSVLGKPISLKRGQFTASVRFMAEKFQWSKDRVKRFLKRCVSWGMIECETATGQSLVTICNYEKYQDGKDAPKDTTKDNPKDGVEDAPKDKLEESIQRKKVKNKKEGAVALLKPEDVPENVWNDFLKQRKTKFTQTALEGIQREVSKAGITTEAALRIAIERGWQSFKADWVKDKGNETNRTNFNGSNGKSRRSREVIAEALYESHGPGIFESPSGGSFESH